MKIFFRSNRKRDVERTTMGIDAHIKAAREELDTYYKFFPNKKRWLDQEVREEILNAMEEECGTIYRSWIKHILRRMSEKGIHPAQTSLCMDAMIEERDSEFMALRVGICVNGAVRKALRTFQNKAYGSFEEFFKDFVSAYQPIVQAAFTEEFDGELYIRDAGKGIFESEPFRKNLAEWKERLQRLFAKTQQEGVQFRALSEEIQYRRLERAERHRLKRLAQEEAARKAQADAEAKRLSQEARLGREARKAEARAKAREANERARQRAEQKRAEWLAAHPRKHSQ